MIQTNLFNEEKTCYLKKKSFVQLFLKKTLGH